MRLQWIVASAVLIILGLAFGASTLLVADSPYDGNVHIDRNPVAPERPTNLNVTSVADHAVAYEQTRLFNDLIASRDHSLDTHDTVITECNASAASETDTEQFRVELRCVGGIDDTNRLFDPGNFSYHVMYRVSDTETRQIDIEGYPFDQRDTLRSPRS